MTALKAQFTEPYLKKQSQFAGGVKRHNVSNINGLWRFWRMKATKKQSQFKANRRALAGNPKQDEWETNDNSQSTIYRILFEKTKPICRRGKSTQC